MQYKDSEYKAKQPGTFLQETFAIGLCWQDPCYANDPDEAHQRARAKIRHTLQTAHFFVVLPLEQREHER